MTQAPGSHDVPILELIPELDRLPPMLRLTGKCPPRLSPWCEMVRWRCRMPMVSVTPKRTQ